MSEERQERGGIVAAIDSTDWTRYAGQGSVVRGRGERRRRRVQAGAALGTTAAVVGAVFVVNGLGQGAVTRQGAAPTSPVASTSGIVGAPGQASGPAPGTPTASGPASAADYPTFPAELPTTPLFVAEPGKVLASGVIGAGSVAGHSWQISYRVIPSGSAANSQPEVTMTDATLDGKTVNVGGSEGADGPQGSGYVVLNLQNSGIKNQMVVASGAPSPSAISVDLRWENGTVVQVPIRKIKGVRIASFAWDPANPPAALEQVSDSGVQQIKITYDTMGTWDALISQPSKFAVTPQPVDATTPAGAPNLSQTPKVAPISSGILGAGTIAGHTWQYAYEVIPSGSAANSSPLVLCTDITVDGVTTGGGCTSAPISGSIGFSFSTDSRSAIPFPLEYDIAPKGTTSVGLEWADGTKSATVTHDVEGWPAAALGFDAANPPKYLLEFGSYGEYRIPFTYASGSTWTFHW
jgi:hypothetical protein